MQFRLCVTAMTLAVKTDPGLWSTPVTLFESPASLNKVMSLLLLAHRALSDGDEEKAVNLTASASALGGVIGLHLEQDHRVPSPSKLYVAVRRRTWSYCVILDKSLMASGHPSSIGSSQLAQHAAHTVPASLRLLHVLALIVSDIVSYLYDRLEDYEKRRYQLHTRLMTWYEALEQEEKAARHTRLYEEWLENRQEGHSTSDHLHGEPSLEFVMACPLPQNWRWSDEILPLVFLYHRARIPTTLSLQTDGRRSSVCCYRYFEAGTGTSFRRDVRIDRRTAHGFSTVTAVALCSCLRVDSCHGAPILRPLECYRLDEALHQYQARL